MQYAYSARVSVRSTRSLLDARPPPAPLVADETVKTVFVSTASSTKLRDTVQSVAAQRGLRAADDVLEVHHLVGLAPAATVSLQAIRISSRNAELPLTISRETSRNGSALHVDHRMRPVRRRRAEAPDTPGSLSAPPARPIFLAMPCVARSSGASLRFSSASSCAGSPGSYPGSPDDTLFELLPPASK